MPDADRLVAASVEATGLDDFGPGAWRDGLEVLVDALEREAGLNDLGAAIFEDRIGNTLRQRLQAHDWFARHPEILDQPVEGPVIVVGLPRTGTTALSNLLACDPATRRPHVWESAAPCPPPDAASVDDDVRIGQTQAGIDMLHELKPIMRIIHDDEATGVAEDLDLLAMSFRAYQHLGMARIPSYRRWWSGADLADAYVLHRRMIQLLGWRCPPHRWHLRNPPDLFCLEVVVRVLPGARFVWCHRDPAEVMASVCELVAEVRDLASDRVDRREVGASRWTTGRRRSIGPWRARAELGEERFVDLWHHEIVDDPPGALATVYERLGWELTAAADAGASAWSTAHGRTVHGEHRPDLGDYGLAPGEVRDRLAAYCERFEV